MSGAADAKMAGPSSKKYGGVLLQEEGKLAIGLDNYITSEDDKKQKFTVETFDLTVRDPL